MKKEEKIGLLLSMIFLFTNVFSQTCELDSKKINNQEKTAKTYLDLMINIESTNLNYGRSNTMLTDYKKPVKGLQAGVSFQAGITSRFSVVSELYFMKKGGKLMVNNPLYTNESTLRLNTLELPVLARLHFGKFIHVGKFYVNAGPSIAYNLSGKRKIGDQTTKLSFHNSSDGFKRFDAGIQMGGGVEFPLKQNRIALDIRYNYGLSNIAYNEEIYNRALMVSVHFSKAWKTNPLEKK
ncbi:porin family protein [Flavobacterium sp. GT3P67]|uniref:porin family protein n=1 Tax=Flavobacterium sp. GT3P67 TaxID=2541722 RepID=UPI00105176FB|nr:porin family protein [Flavobacterium sp. GT3P67]TDE48402.1 PorT family protein [Flavobacterium sp. GT3P67]